MKTFHDVFTCNIPASALGDEMKCMLSRLADGPGLGAVIAVLEGRDAVQRDIKHLPVIGQRQTQGHEDEK